MTEADYIFDFPNARIFMQTLIDVNPLAEYLTLAWEFNLDTKKPEYFLIQAVMAKQETCMTQRFAADWILRSKFESWTPPPFYPEKMQIQPLQLQPCSCSHVSTQTLIQIPNRSILEICTLNVSSMLPKVKKQFKHEILDQLAIQAFVSLSSNTIEFHFLPIVENREEEKDKLHFYQNLLSTIETAPKPSPLQHFLQSQEWSEITSQQVLAHLEAPKTAIKEPIIETLLDRNLVLPTFIFPYQLPIDPDLAKTIHKPEDKRNELSDCSLCRMIRSDHIASFKLDSIDRWQRKYDEEQQQQQEKDEKQIHQPSFPLSPMIVNTIRKVRDQLKELTPSHLVLGERLCPVVRANETYLEVEFLLPALQQFARDLQLTSSLGIFAFYSDKIILLAEGEVGWTRFEFEPNPSSTHPKPHFLPFYHIHHCAQPFHIEIPLRQIALFPKLTTPQNQYLNPHYVRFKIRPDSDYIELSAFSDDHKREVFQLLFSYHKLQQACLTTDLSEESAGEGPN